MRSLMPAFDMRAVKAAVLVGAGAVGAYLLWPLAGPAAAMMKAPGAAGFLANPQLYFELLRTAGAAAAAAA